MGRIGNPNKRKGSTNPRKMMSPKQQQRRRAIYLFNTRQQSDLKRFKVERQNQKEPNPTTLGSR